MRNGPYILVVAPADYPGFRYRGRYVYEHHLVWWRHTGQLVPEGSILHHRDGDKHRNVIDNLELQSRAEHMAEHKPQPGPKRRTLLTCPSCLSWFSVKPGDAKRRTYCSLPCANLGMTNGTRPKDAI